MDSIIYATDFSQNSVSALKMAYAFSQKLDVKLMVLHVFDMNLTIANPLSLTHAKKEKEAFARHGKALKEFCNTHLNLAQDEKNLRFEVKEHAIVKEGIHAAIKENSAGMLVMGLKGKSMLKEVFMGSNTKGMVDTSPCPVLAVPSSWEKYEMENILYATDFEEADIRSIDWLVNSLAVPFGSSLHVFHVGTKNEYAGEDQMQWFQEMLGQKVTYDGITFEMTHSEDVFGTLLKQVNDTKADVLVMLEREKEGFFTSLIQGDKVMQMISKGNVPLLTFNKNLFL
ncbi:universal stress protein [Muricauda sp. JGD-17]|uniref:Universal stress protein n=1 Tax=Flagellimonas ochracea TaxID=2696472 RepID=A0A964TCL6_9FLAO|nr:universal stress protein [Allomuricauda ochracea]NAY92412.1 universal stress protein [Allomuricauda ochracea]